MAALWQGSAAMAAGLLTITSATSTWTAGMQVVAPGLPPIEGGSFADEPAMQSGVAAVNEAHMVWEVETGQEPGGGGSLRSAGHMDMAQTASYTLEHPSTTLASLRTSGLSQTTGQWSFQDANLDFITDTPAEGWTNGVQILNLRVDRPIDLRLSGRMWAQVAGGNVTASSNYRENGSGVIQSLFVRNTADDPGSFEYQWRLPGAGLLRLYISDFTTQLMPCCNIEFSGSSGWDMTLEANALPAVPEPTSAGLLLAGLAAWGLRRRMPTRTCTAPEAQP